VPQKKCPFSGSRPTKTHTGHITSLTRAYVDPVPEKFMIDLNLSRYNTEENIKVGAASWNVTA
jgi:hypothetical protein